jgi:hypothetical protein
MIICDALHQELAGRADEEQCTTARFFELVINSVRGTWIGRPTNCFLLILKPTKGVRSVYSLFQERLQLCGSPLKFSPSNGPPARLIQLETR